MNKLFKGSLLALVVALMSGVNVEAGFVSAKKRKAEKAELAKAEQMIAYQDSQLKRAEGLFNPEKPSKKARAKYAAKQAAAFGKKAFFHNGSRAGFGALAVAGLGLGFGDFAVNGVKTLINKVKKSDSKEAVDTLAPAAQSVAAKRLTIARRVLGSVIAAASTAALVASVGIPAGQAVKGKVAKIKADRKAKKEEKAKAAATPVVAAPAAPAPAKKKAK